MKRFRHLLQESLPVAVLGFGILVAVWFVASRPQALPRPPSEKVWPVAVVTAEILDVQPEIIAFGEVMAAREAEIRALVDGRIVALNPEFRSGAFVAAGTELARIDPVDYENALAERRADLARVEAELDQFRRELEWERTLIKNAERQVELSQRGLARTEKLASDGRESKKARDDAEAALARDEQNLYQRRQAVERLTAGVRQQQAALDKARTGVAIAERKVAQTRVVAPFDGYVTDVRLALGQLLGIGESLGRLLSGAELEARFEIPEHEFDRLLSLASDGNNAALIGRRVDLVWRLGAGERRFEAHVSRIGAEIDPAVGGIELWASIDGAAAAEGLRGGAFIEARMADVVYYNVLRVPSRAMTDDRFLYVVREGRLEQVEVEIARDAGNDILVRGPIANGEAIVAHAFSGIGPGLRARALDAPTPAPAP